jgi:hypothetical protein
MCGASSVFEIEMHEINRCKIVDVNIAEFQGLAMFASWRRAEKTAVPGVP